MNDQNEVSEEDLRRDFDGRSIDWFLQELVAIANLGDSEFGVTLNVEGCVISGILIGSKKYFQLFADSFVSGWEDSDSKSFWHQHFISTGESISPAPSDPTSPLPHYLHLRDAKVQHPTGAMPSMSGVLWRGRVNAVSGFSLGVLEKAT